MSRRRSAVFPRRTPRRCDCGRGFDSDAIATALALEPKAIAPLLAVAEAKLETLCHEFDTPIVAAADESFGEAS